MMSQCQVIRQIHSMARRGPKVIGCLLVGLLLLGAGIPGFQDLGSISQASEREIISGWTLSRLRLHAFRDTRVKAGLTSLQPATDPQFRENQLAIKSQKTILPGRELTAGNPNGSYTVNYAGKKLVFYSGLGKTQGVAFINSEAFPQKTTLYAYPSGVLKTIAMTFSPKDTFVFTGDGELAEGPNTLGKARVASKDYEDEDVDAEIEVRASSGVNKETSLSAADNRLWQRASYERKVVEVGQRLLKANNIQQSISFMVDKTQKEINAYSQVSTSQVLITNELLASISSDDELAGILGHELGHVLLNHQMPHAGTAYRYGRYVIRNENAIKYDQLQSKEVDADARGVELAMKAGYNPWGLHTALQKILNDTDADALGRSGHPQGSQRLKILAHYIQGLESQKQKAAVVAAPASMFMAIAPKVPPFGPGVSIRLGQWAEVAARREVLKQTVLTDLLQKEIVKLPAMDPDFTLHQSIIKGQLNASDRALYYSEFIGPYADLMKDTQQGSTSYAVFFPQVKAYPTYKMDGHLRSFSLCNQAQYPRTCSTVNAADSGLIGLNFEVTESSRFGFDQQGKLLNYTLDNQTYNAQRQRISLSKRFAGP